MGTGTGMSVEVVELATALFFTTKERGRGKGLGLWMVQRFMAAHDGKVAFEIKPARGTMVRLVFPRADPAMD